VHNNIPLLIIILRLCLRVYTTLPPKNIIEELTPCATISMVAPLTPKEEKYIIPPITNPVCATDEYAIITFISNWKIQITPISAEPETAVEIIKLNKSLGLKNGENRAKPYPPNFNKIAAKIMDPIIGASTWALGSHKCPIKIGSFTKKANIILKIKIWDKEIFLINKKNCKI